MLALNSTTVTEITRVAKLRTETPRDKMSDFNLEIYLHRTKP